MSEQMRKMILKLGIQNSELSEKKYLTKYLNLILIHLDDLRNSFI